MSVPDISAPRFSLRKAAPRDLERLAALAGPGRPSRRSLRGLLKAQSAELILAEAASRTWRDGGSGRQLDFGFRRVEPEEDRALLGYALVLFREGARAARLRALTVGAGGRIKGVANALLAAAEEAARARGAQVLRLDLPAGDSDALKRHERRGYRRLPVSNGPHGSKGAVRLERPLAGEPAIPVRIVPYYAQTTDFTCGPATLMMAFAGLGDSRSLDREHEFALWREATSIYLLGAPGGCEPYGLAVAAARRGLRPSIHVSEPGPYFIEARKGEARRDIMAEAQRIFRKEAERLAIPVTRKAISTEALRSALDRNAIAIVLISCLMLHGDTTPHWIAVYAADTHHVFAHDPWFDRQSRKPKPGQALAIPVPDFERMSQWGRSRLRATILIERPTAD